MDSMKPQGLLTDTSAAQEEVKCQIATEEIDVNCGDMVRITLLNEAECDTVLAAEIASQDDFKAPAMVTSLIGADGQLTGSIADFTTINQPGIPRQNQQDQQNHKEEDMRPKAWSWEEETFEDHNPVDNQQAVRKVKVLKIRALNVLAKLEVEDVCEKIARDTFNPAKESANSCSHKWSTTCCAELQNEELVVKDISEKDRLAQLLSDHQLMMEGQLSGLKAPAGLSGTGTDASAIFRPLRVASLKPSSKNPF